MFSYSISFILILITLTFNACSDFKSLNFASQDQSSSTEVLTREEYIIAGDMLIAQARLEQQGDGTMRVAGTADREPTWPNGIIPFQFNGYSDSEKQRVLEACTAWTAVANVRCVEHTTQPFFVSADKNPLYGCSATVGYVRNALFTLGEPRCWERGVIIHEIGHLMGLMHEHQHPDRDSNLEFTLNPTSLVDTIEYQVNFGRVYRSISAYDPFSIMHYSISAPGRAFILNSYTTGQRLGTVRILARPGSQADSDISRVGQRIALGNGDIAAARSLYGAPPPTVDPCAGMAPREVAVGGQQTRSVACPTGTTGSATQTYQVYQRQVCVSGTYQNDGAAFERVIGTSTSSCITPPPTDPCAGMPPREVTVGGQQTRSVACPTGTTGSATQTYQVYQRQVCMSGTYQNEGAAFERSVSVDNSACVTPPPPPPPQDPCAGMPPREVAVGGQQTRSVACPTGTTGSATETFQVYQSQVCVAGAYQNSGSPFERSLSVNTSACATPPPPPPPDLCAGMPPREVTVGGQQTRSVACPTGTTGAATETFQIFQRQVCVAGNYQNDGSSFERSLSVDNSNCVTPTPPSTRTINCSMPGLTQTEGFVHQVGYAVGDVWGIHNEGNRYFLRGWACKVGTTVAPALHVYSGGRAGAPGANGPLGTWANELDPHAPANSAINAVCATPDQTPHIYKIDITPMIEAGQTGQPLYVHVIADGAPNSLYLIAGSGRCLVP